MAEYIEREAAINELRETHKRFYTPPSEPMCFSDVVGVIKNVSAAEVVEVKRGRWIWDDNAMDWGLGGWVCSECEEKNDNIPAKPDINPYGWVGSFYCPNCGADMRGKA